LAEADEDETSSESGAISSGPGEFSYRVKLHAAREVQAASCALSLFPKRDYGEYQASYKLELARRSTAEPQPCWKCGKRELPARAPAELSRLSPGGDRADLGPAPLDREHEPQGSPAPPPGMKTTNLMKSARAGDGRTQLSSGGAELKRAVEVEQAQIRLEQSRTRYLAMRQK